MAKWSNMLLAAEPVAEDVPQGSYSSQLLGTTAPGQDTTAAAPAGVAPEPDAPTWWGRRAQDIRGKQDARYAGLPDLRDALVEEGSTDVTRPMAASALFNGSDAQMGDIARKALGPRLIGSERDANGYEIIRYLGKDGSEKAAYVNRPGLDINDLGRGATAALPYMVAGGAAGAMLGGAGLGVQMLGQALAAGGTSVAGDLAQIPFGSEQAVEIPKAGFAAAGGAAAPPIAAAISALARRILTIPSLFDKVTGRLTPKGAEVARTAGVDPAELTAEAQKVFAKTYAMTPDAAEAATRANVEPFGIPTTKGQVTKDPYLLTQEEGMRRRLSGEAAQDIMRTFDIEQSQAIRGAALGGGAGRQSVAPTIAPNRNPGLSPADANPMNLGQSIRSGATAAREGARQAEGEAWRQVPDLTPTQDAFDILPATLNKRLTDVAIDSEITPAAAKMAQELDRFIAGEAPDQVAKVLANNPVKTVDQMRRRLLRMSRGAAAGEDQRAAAAVYDGFNDWIDEAATRNLLQGDVNAAAQLKVARGFTKEVRDLFEPTAGGKSSQAARRLTGVLSTADSPEGVINQLLGSTGSRGADQGTTQALANLKVALNKFTPADVAKSTWDDVRLAYWVRMVQGRNGEMLGPTAIMNNIRTAFANQRSAVNVLYSADEQRLIHQFMKAMEAVSFKPPNASGSGYTAASFIKDGVAKLFEAFGLKSKLGQTVLEYSGLGNAYGTAAARAAVNQGVKPRPPNLAPALSSAGATTARDRNDR